MININKDSGFTYLWVLFVVLILGIFSMLSLDFYQFKKQQENEKILLYQGHEFRRAIKSYHDLSDQSGIMGYPASIDQLINDERFPYTVHHLRKLYIDPMTGKSDWVLVRIGDKIVGVHSASKAKVFKKTNFSSEDIGLEDKNRYEEWVFSYPTDLALLEE